MLASGEHFLLPLLNKNLRFSDFSVPVIKTKNICGPNIKRSDFII